MANKIDKAESLTELCELGVDKLDSTGFLSVAFLDSLLERAYSLGFRAGKETEDEVF